jgi:hypothetical protein
MKKKSFTPGDLVEVDRDGSWILAAYVEEQPATEPGDHASHIVRVRGERRDHSVSPRRIRVAEVPRLAVHLLRTAERLLVEQGDPMPVLAAARHVGVDLRGPAWALAVRARAVAGGERDEAQLRRAAALIESGRLTPDPPTEPPRRRRV